MRTNSIASRFKSWLAALLLSLAPLAPAGAQNGAPEADSAAFRQVIESQLDAFARDDGDDAFSYASPTIRSIFGTPANFMDMVRGGYQPVYRPRAHDFQAPRAIEGGWEQPMIVVGPDGITYLAIYEMQRQNDGSWKINGCRILRLAQQSV